MCMNVKMSQKTCCYFVVSIKIYMSLFNLRIFMTVLIQMGKSTATGFKNACYVVFSFGL